jgi:PTH1 family peptidyl-tRNA hydrolase
MPLFQRKPTADFTAPLYTLGESTTLLIVGLGNPGKEYDNTRHNIGFEILDHFAEKQGFDPWVNKKDMHSIQTSMTIGSARVILCKPTTFMNESGRGVKETQHFYKIDNSRTLVVYDELDIDFGHLRTRMGGSDAGHNGIKSVTSACGEHYGRLRIGIGPKKPKEMDTSDFVLAQFNPKQMEQMPDLLQEAKAVLSEFAHANGDLVAETRSFVL